MEVHLITGFEDNAGISEVGGRQKQLAGRSESFDIGQVYGKREISETSSGIGYSSRLRALFTPHATRLLIGYWSNPKITPKQAWNWCGEVLA